MQAIGLKGAGIGSKALQQKWSWNHAIASEELAIDGLEAGSVLRAVIRWYSHL